MFALRSNSAYSLFFLEQRFSFPLCLSDRLLYIPSSILNINRLELLNRTHVVLLVSALTEALEANTTFPWKTSSTTVLGP